MIKRTIYFFILVSFLFALGGCVVNSGQDTDISENTISSPNDLPNGLEDTKVFFYDSDKKLVHC